MPDLDHRWPALLAQRSDIRDSLASAYAEPQRGYHNTKHLLEVFERIDLILADEPARSEGDAPACNIDLDAVLLAAWFHDAVYDTDDNRDGDNEERSAVLAMETLTDADLPETLVGEVARLVRVTATHQVAADDSNGQLLCDADLGILAADEQRYAEYTSGVRREYQHVPEQDFRTGRARILRALLAAPTLFHTAFARQHWENPARANVKRELADLEA